MTTIKINITKEILERSKMCKNVTGAPEEQSIAANCAIALAVRDIFPKAWIGTEDIQPFYFNKTTEEVYIDLPMEATLFIGKFDKLPPEERVKMEPFSFNIEVPDEVVNEIGITEVHEILSKSPTLELIEL